MSLLNDLVSYWRLDEESGPAIDQHGDNNLQANNSPGSGPGVLGTARTFNGSNQSLSTNSPALQVGDTDFTVSAWARLDSLSASQNLLGVWSIFFGGRSYRLIYVFGDQQFYFQVSTDGLATTTVIASSFGAVEAETWYHVMGWYDSQENTISVSVNGIDNSGAFSDSIHTSGANFVIGRNADGSVPFGGRIDEAAMWKRLLTPRERATLFNGGNGFGYEESPWGVGGKGFPMSRLTN